jgi:transcriptional regulator with XRE-family HTH domain
VVIGFVNSYNSIYNADIRTTRGGGLKQLQDALLRAITASGKSKASYARSHQIDNDLISRILNNKITQTPSFGNIEKLAFALQVPPWQIMIWLGIPLGLPDGEDARLAQLQTLAARQPNLRQLLDRLMAIAPDHPDYVDAALGYLEFAIAQGEAESRRDQSDDSDR